MTGRLPYRIRTACPYSLIAGTGVGRHSSREFGKSYYHYAQNKKLTGVVIACITGG